jgi:hypothetical protein
MHWFNIIKTAGIERRRLFRGINIPKEIGEMRPANVRIRPNVILTRHAIERMQGKDVSTEPTIGARTGETVYRDLEGVWYFDGAMDAIQEGIESGRFKSLLSGKFGKKGQLILRLNNVGHGRMGWLVRKHNTLENTLYVTTYLSYGGLPEGSGANTVQLNKVSTPLHPISPPRMDSEPWVHPKDRQKEQVEKPKELSWREKAEIEIVKIKGFQEKFLNQIFRDPPPTNTKELIETAKSQSGTTNRGKFMQQLAMNAALKWDF